MDLILLLLFHPQRAARELPRHQPLLRVAFVLLLACLSEVLATLLVVRATTGEGSGVAFLIWTVLVNLGVVGVSLLAASIFLPFGARMMGGEGRNEDFLWSLGLSYSPWVFWAGLGLLFQMSSMAPFFLVSAQLFLSAWIFWIQVLSLAAVFGISPLRALFSAFLGYGLAALLFVLFLGIGCLSLGSTLALWITV
jgi:hypothetical protein